MLRDLPQSPDKRRSNIAHIITYEQEDSVNNCVFLCVTVQVLSNDAP
jgi:hypothetical protein